MIAKIFDRRQRVDVPCLIHVANTWERLEAHVELGDGLQVEPGDEVIVHGSPVKVPYGETAVFARTATVVRATALERAWTRLRGDLEFMELCEFSFSSGEKL
jgi:hypothetical protein